MNSLFLRPPPLFTTSRPRPLVDSRRPPLATAGKSGRSPWPLSRFVQTLVFYSPLSRLISGSVNAAAAFRTRSMSSSTTSNLILVTGASGATGSRVVKQLINNGYKPRALTRSREKLVEALKQRDVDMEQLEKEGKLEVFVTDLYNLPDQIFQGVQAVISCTGVTVAAKGDSPDRSKYLQGLKFYEPSIVEDTPENVEYIGVGNLAKGMRKWTASEGVDVVRFEKDEVKNIWGALDDVVMGGVSKGNARVEGNELVFGGFVSTDNFGGFSSIRSVELGGIDLGQYDGIVLRVKGDGKRYKFILRSDGKWDGIGHCFSFDTKMGEWKDVFLNFDESKPVFRGKTVKGKLDKRRITSLQLMLSKFEYDGELNSKFEAGPFEIRVASIKTFKKSKSPRIVHVGSAGVTRVLRKEEFNLEEQPPAVRMNEALGRILDWKFAGEDEIRQSGVPYLILRPCALTEKEAVGIDGVRFEQGDTLTGQISRGDLASICVSVLSGKVEGVTTEIAWGEGGKLDGLQRDTEQSREFASYPYVPVAVESN